MVLLKFQQFQTTKRITMFVNELIKYAMKNGYENSDYKKKYVTFVISINENGELLGIQNTNDGKKVPQQLLLPNEPNRTGGIYPNLINDKSDYVFGIFSNNALDEKTINKLTNRHDAYKKRLEDIFKETQDPAILALITFINTPNIANLVFNKIEKQYKETDTFAFKYESTNTKDTNNNDLITDRILVKTYWKKQRNKITEIENPYMCCVSGEIVNDPPKMTKIKKINGCLSTGGTLCSINENNSESWNLSGNTSAVISKDIQDKIVYAIDMLIEKNQVCKQENENWLYWTNDNDEIITNMFSSILKNDCKTLNNLFDSVHTGKIINNTNDAKFYVIKINGQNGRCAVTEFNQTTIENFKNNIKQYFENTQIELGQINKHFPIGAIIQALKNPESNKVNPNTYKNLTKCIINGLKFPQDIQHILNNRIQINEVKSKPDNLNTIRIATLKAIVNQHNKHKDITTNMNPNSTDNFYIMGLIMATAEKINKLANPELKNTIKTKLYSQFTKKPKQTFNNINEKVQIYIQQAKNRNNNFIYCLENLFNHLVSSVNINTQIETMTTDQQSIFHIAYAQMFQWFKLSTEELEKWKTQYENIDKCFSYNRWETNTKMEIE